MGRIERAWRDGMSRREAIANLTAFLAASPLLRAQQDPHSIRDHQRFLGLDEMVDVYDFEPHFYHNVPLKVYDYNAHGTDSEFTLRRNRDAFDWVELVPGQAVASDRIDTRTELFGHPLRSPIMIAPTASQRDLHPEGENAMHVAATAADTTMLVSHASQFPFDQIAEAADGPLWAQFYPRPDLDNSREVLEGFQASGAETIIVTIDQQASLYERDLHDRHLGGVPRTIRMTRPDRGNPYGVSEGRLWYEWRHFNELRPMIQVPMLAKGILTAEGALMCLDYGVEGIVVSNHGGRSIDYGPSSLEVLEEIVQAVDGRVPILIDSGFRRGRDVLKALALGADAVCLGRAVRWGLAAFGAAGAEKVLEIVNAELVQAMAEAGVTSIAEIDRSIVRTDFP